MEAAGGDLSMGRSQAAWLARLGAELDNLRAAYRHLVDRGRFPEALRLVVALGDELLMREKLEIERWATELAALPALAGGPLRAAALGLAANASLLRGRLDEAHTRALAAIEAEALTGAPPSWMPRNALAILTVLRVVEGDWQDHLDAMEAIGDATGDPFPRAMTLWNRAFVDVLVGEPDRAEPSAVQLRALGERHDNPSMRAMGLLWLGRVAALRHDVDRARDLLHQALGAAEAAQTTLVVNRTMRALADLASGTGDHTAGLAALRRVARSFAASGNVAEQLQTVMSMAEQFVALGDLTSAATALGALSRTPMAATAGYKAIAGIVAERLDPAERLSARRRGSSLDPEALMDQLVRAIDDLAGQAAEQGEDQR
jgi:hypothetical protein